MGCALDVRPRFATRWSSTRPVGPKPGPKAGGRHMRARTTIWVLAFASACGGDDTGVDDVEGSGSASLSAEGSGSTAPATSEGSASLSGGTTATSDPDTSAGSSGDEPIFDVGAGETGPIIPGECCGDAEWSYIWIANSTQSTVSKINTRTLVEEGRYYTRETPGNPSRTSVSVDGRAVAVANRFGGVVKIWARPENCAGNNTSSGAGDI